MAYSLNAIPKEAVAPIKINARIKSPKKNGMAIETKGSKNSPIPEPK